MVAVTAHSELGTAAAMFYLAAYALMNIGAFGIVVHFSRKGERYLEIQDFAGLGARQPATAALLSIYLLSLIGVPLTAGFFGKFYVLRAARDARRERAPARAGRPSAARSGSPAASRRSGPAPGPSGRPAGPASRPATQAGSARGRGRRRPDAGETGCGSLAGSAPAECDFYRFLQYCLRNEAIRHFGSSAVPQFEVTMIVSEQLDRFFTEVMVLTEDQALRRNRVALLKSMQDQFFRVARFSEIQG